MQCALGRFLFAVLCLSSSIAVSSLPGSEREPFRNALPEITSSSASTIEPAETDAAGSTMYSDLDANLSLSEECWTSSSGLLEELTFFLGVDGSKQPQDFGVNALIGGQASVNWGIPLIDHLGIGAQIGTGITAASNAVQVYELLGETTGRTQSYTTVGLFQRFDNGFSWGFGHDFLYQKYYDDFSLSQWRVSGSHYVTGCDQVGITTMLNSKSATGTFGASTSVTLSPITQAHIYWRHYWETGAQTSLWFGMAEGHGEDNAVTGPAPPKDEQFLFGADILAPLSAHLAIYGETNIMMPADTGTVDAFLGIQWSPGRYSVDARRGRFSPLLPLASPVSFAVDLSQ